MIGAATTAIITAGLVCLFLASVRLQLVDVRVAPSRRLLAGILKSWRLFAPVPARTDVHLVYRDLDAAGDALPPLEVATLQGRRARDWLWNPSKRRWLPLRSLMVQLARAANDLGDDRLGLAITPAYLVLLARVTAEPRGDAVARQFLLLERFGADPEHDTVVVFCSALHRFDDDQ